MSIDSIDSTDSARKLRFHNEFGIKFMQLHIELMLQAHFSDNLSDDEYHDARMTKNDTSMFRCDKKSKKQNQERKQEINQVKSASKQSNSSNFNNL
jgi:hypothetical protein